MKENLIGRKVITPSGHETTIIAFDTDVNKYFCHVNGAKCFIDGDDYKILPLPIKSYKPTIVERFADNGAHSHWELIETYTGEVLWIENDIEPKTSVEPDCANHPRDLFGETDMKIVAEKIGNLHYKSLYQFLEALSDKLNNDGGKDIEGGRKNLGICLKYASGYMQSAANNIEEAWQISNPFMKGE